MGRLRLCTNQVVRLMNIHKGRCKLCIPGGAEGLLSFLAVWPPLLHSSGHRLIFQLFSFVNVPPAASSAQTERR